MKKVKKINNHDTIIRKENIIFRNIHGSFFLIDITDKFTEDRCSLFEINEIGTFLWKIMADEITPEEMTKQLKAAIIDEIDYDILYHDVTEFLISLLQKNFIEVYNNG